MTEDEYNGPLVEVYHAAMRAVDVGKAKYPEPTWREVTLDYHFAALLRHLAAWSTSVNRSDPVTGLSHLDHAAARLAMLLAVGKEKLGE